MRKFKVGDKIVVKGGRWYKNHEQFVIEVCCFVPEMKQYLGKVGEITSIEEEGYKIDFRDGKKCPYWFHDSLIRTYHEPEYKQETVGSGNHFDKKNFVLELSYEETVAAIKISKLVDAAIIRKSDDVQNFINKMSDIEKAFKE